MIRSVPIRLPDGKVVPIEQIERSHADRARFLGPHHGNRGDVLCLCREDGVPLGVGRRTVPTTIYYFYPLHRTDPQRHAIGCPNRLDPNTKPSTAEHLPVVETVGDRVCVNLGAPLYREEVTDPDNARLHQRDPIHGESQPSANGKLLSLLEVLWSEAELTSWHPRFLGKRTYAIVAHRIREAAKNIQIRKTNLAPLFYMPPAWSRSREADIDLEIAQFLNNLAGNERRAYFGYVLGVLKETEVLGRRVILKLGHTTLRLWVERGTWDRQVHRWYGAGAPEKPSVVLAKVRRIDGRHGPWLSVEDVAVLRIADEITYIPIDSTHERRLVETLTQSRRWFRKPLSVDVPPGEMVPDFILEDRSDRLHLEVLGRMSDPEYRVHTDEKRVRYTKAGQAVWWWNVDESRGIPEIPRPNLNHYQPTGTLSAQDPPQRAQ